MGNQRPGETAAAMGITLDEAKIADAALANASLDTLLQELQRRFPGATSCESELREAARSVERSIC